MRPNSITILLAVATVLCASALLIYAPTVRACCKPKFKPTKPHLYVGDLSQKTGAASRSKSRLSAPVRQFSKDLRNGRNQLSDRVSKKQNAR